MNTKVIASILLLFTVGSSLRIPLRLSQPMTEYNERRLFFVSNPVVYGHESEYHDKDHQQLLLDIHLSNSKDKKNPSGPRIPVVVSTGVPNTFVVGTGCTAGDCSVGGDVPSFSCAGHCQSHQKLTKPQDFLRYATHGPITVTQGEVVHTALEVGGTWANNMEVTVASALKKESEADRRSVLHGNGVLGLGYKDSGSLPMQLLAQKKIDVGMFSFFESGGYWFLALGRNQTYLWKGQMTDYKFHNTQSGQWGLPLTQLGVATSMTTPKAKSHLNFDPTVYGYVLSPAALKTAVSHLGNKHRKCSVKGAVVECSNCHSTSDLPSTHFKLDGSSRTWELNGDAMAESHNGKCTVHLSSSSHVTGSNVVAGRLFLRSKYVLFDHQGSRVGLADSTLQQPTSPFMSKRTVGCVIGIGIAGILVSVIGMFALVKTLTPQDLQAVGGRNF